VEGTVYYLFPPFRLDLLNEQLWRNEEEIILRRKTFEVLRYLLEHQGRLVTKEALLDTIWGEVAVSDSLPSVCVGELRKALADEAKMPHFIETVHGRGYRFIARVTSVPASYSTAPLASPSLSLGPAQIIVGRESEFVRMREWYAQTLSGERRVVFITGEAGIGKTTFVRAFLKSIDTENRSRIAHGQCIEQYGAGEPYMPVLEALTRICRESDGERVIGLLNKFAPAWLPQMPSLLNAEERLHQQPTAQQGTQLRMLREMAEALEAIAAERPLVLLFEDLHWSDFSTLELIAAIARRNEPARLLILGTYRPVEMLANNHPLRAIKQELELHRQCKELGLRLLKESEVAEYLAQRFANDGTAQSLERVAPVIYEYTEGNPLFMVNVVDDLVEQSSLLNLSKIEAPRDIRQMIERNLERLDGDEQRVLEAASVAGAGFSAAAVAAALQRPVSEVEDLCARLSRREQFLNTQGVTNWPDGTIASSFRFHHALYCDILYDRVPASQRVELHSRIAKREESAFGTRAREIAAELAHHYARSGNRSGAVKYLGLAAEQAMSRSAYVEAQDQLNSALELLQTQPESRERDGRELALVRLLIQVLWMTKGISHPHTTQTTERATALAENSGNLRQLVNLMISRAGSALIAGDDLSTAAALTDQALELALRQGDGSGADLDMSLLHFIQFALRYNRGDLFAAENDFSKGLAFFGQAASATISTLAFASPNVWLLGRANVARERESQMMAAAKEARPVDIGLALLHAALLRIWMRDYEQAEAIAARAVAHSDKYQFAESPKVTRCLLGHTRAQLGRVAEGIALLREGLSAWGEIPHWSIGFSTAFLAVAEGQVGASADALKTIERALRANPDELVYRPEILRVRGELHLKQQHHKLAEVDFRESIALAQQMSAKSWELRTTMSLARLFAKQGRRHEARTTLAKIYNWFTEGFDTADLKDAKTLLEKLAT
jgi:predicted ATPase/DNA-binding winged helix-turn-helix (wHTH) protein